MKSKNIRIFGLLFTLALLLTTPLAVMAASDSQLQLSNKVSKVKIGDKFTIDVLVKNAPTIYGADVRLVFDPKMVEGVDADKNTAGIQLKQGNFIDPGKSFLILNKVDNVAGTAAYALTLLNPAPAVSGNGQIAQITFRAKAAGQTTITLVQGLFGTKTGVKITPLLDNAKISIDIKEKNGIVVAAQANPAGGSNSDQTQMVEDSNLQASSEPINSGPISQIILYSGLGGFGLVGSALAFISIRRIQPGTDQKNKK